MTDPADFYTGLVADLYAPLRSADPDPEPLARFIGEHGEPALELGCGDGDPLLALRALGLDVEGVDASADMLERCRQRAAAAGLDVVTHHQRMEQLDLGRRFRSIVIAGPTFNLLPDDDLAAAALARIAAHLEAGGAALVPLIVPAPTPPELLGQGRELVGPDGASTIRVTAVAEERDERRRTQQTLLRYERTTPSGHEQVDRPWVLHWYTPTGFAALAEAAGLAVTVADERPRRSTCLLRHRPAPSPP